MLPLSLDLQRILHDSSSQAKLFALSHSELSRSSHGTEQCPDQVIDAHKLLNNHDEVIGSRVSIGSYECKVKLPGKQRPP